VPQAPLPSSPNAPPASSEEGRGAGDREEEEGEEGALAVVLKYVEACRISGQGGAGGEEEEGEGTSWAREQAAPKPTLLPELKFHDLVFGQ
jgi:hypothetical protein